ncbi:hypothetical protein ITI46_16325 [Streptomyces oryzae]|uniref:Uncharacterized protein n=1 Tax=Streptomyces oryzae TaxID=1434886 RepID=A0ABS3XDW1_9ACTN|nr:hypothetical protein [Streptomyces oryzae]MBO8193222.1 hypothetical protein [Streptomyces oryzae]
MEQESPQQEQPMPCQDCEWFRVMINRSALDPKPRADLEALFGAHLHRKHAPDTANQRGLRGV